MSNMATAQAASPVSSPAQSCPPAKKTRRLVPSLPVAGTAQESRSSADNQRGSLSESPQVLQQEPPPAAIKAKLPSVFSFL